MARNPKTHDKSTADNRSRQLNPEHDAYRRSRGEIGGPEVGGNTPPSQEEGGQKPG
jgi:hypothetical protein